MNENDVPPPSELKIYAQIFAYLDTLSKQLDSVIDILKTLKKDTTK